MTHCTKNLFEATPVSKLLKRDTQQLGTYTNGCRVLVERAMKIRMVETYEFLLD